MMHHMKINTNIKRHKPNYKITAEINMLISDHWSVPKIMYNDCVHCTVYMGYYIVGLHYNRPFLNI